MKKKILKKTKRVEFLGNRDETPSESDSSTMTQIRRIEELLQPTTKQKALQAARTFQQLVLHSTGLVDYYDLASESVKKLFTNLSQPEINVIITFVLSDTLRATEEDLREIKEELHKMEQAQLKLREDIRPLERTYDLSGKDNTTSQDLKENLNKMKGKLDGMNEMSEMTALRIQMTMDRRSKFISTLSQIMKKISTTQDILIQNIK